ncbi:MAG: GFA family protein [Pseudomonadota bacterium]
MALPEPPFEGSCLCGAVKVRITEPPLLTMACHCHDCQKMSASAYSLGTLFPSSGFCCSGELIRGGRGSGARTHYYCKSCLSLVYTQVEGADDRINLRTSMLNEAALFEPFVELMTDEKMPWADVPVVHSFNRFPTSADELKSLLEEYAKL